MHQAESNLLHRLRDRSDTGAWLLFDRLYRPMLTAYAHARGLNAADAEDVAQQCAQAVVENIDRYEHTASLQAWLRAIARRKVADVFRRRGREVQPDPGTLTNHPHRQAAGIGCRRWTTAHVVRCAEVVRHEVAPTTFAAFVGFALERRPAAAVAGELGITPNQVYVAKHRVIERIRKRASEITGSDEMTAE